MKTRWIVSIQKQSEAQIERFISRHDNQKSLQLLLLRKRTPLANINYEENVSQTQDENSPPA